MTSVHERIFSATEQTSFGGLDLDYDACSVRECITFLRHLSLLFLTLTYVSSFGLHDCRRLLDRAPPNQRRTEPSDPAPTVRPLPIEDSEGPTRVLLGAQPPQQLPPGPLSP